MANARYDYESVGDAPSTAIAIKGDADSSCRATACSFDSNDDIRMTMILGSLIYTLDGIRQFERQNYLSASFQGQHDGAKLKLITGDYNFIDAQGNVKVTPPSKTPANPLDPQDLEELLDGPLLRDNKDLNNEFTRRNILHLKKFNEGNANHNVFVNNFNAVKNDEEVVYAITALKKDTALKKANQIAVVFRGSVYTTDWLRNLTASLTEIRIRIEGDKAWLIEGCTFQRIEIDFELSKRLQEATQKNPIRVHTGFLTYLFARQERNAMPKYHAIVNNVGNLMGHHSFVAESELTITGHSLGGALTTLLSFFLACDKTIADDRVRRSRKYVRRYISCISFASPLVGDEGFRRAFAVLEEEDRLRHVRITNERDFVPLLPPLPCYRHTGVQVHLRGKDWRGKQQEADLIDTGIVKKSSLGAFIGCMLTTFPPVILLPLYFILCHIPFGIEIVALVIIMTPLSPLLKTKNKVLVILRETILPLVAVPALYLLVVHLPRLKKVTEEIIPTELIYLLAECHGLIIGVILLSQVMMFMHQPQHIFDSKCKDENGDELGITHSLSFYDYNLKGAESKLSSRKPKPVSSLSSSTKIWKDGNNRGK